MRVWGKLVQADWTQDFVSKTALGTYLMISVFPPILNHDSVAKAQGHNYQSIWATGEE
jgi:hypothetical protein